MDKRHLQVITQALRQNPARAKRWGMTLIKRRLQQERVPGKIGRIIEFRDKWIDLCRKVEEE